MSPTIEGLENDPVVIALRAAFTAEHALQCGYCTPGMLVTARDIVLRCQTRMTARIRLELAGNLCRCTGYAGIVRAISRVLREDVARCCEAPTPRLPQLASLSATPALELGVSPMATATLPPARPALTLTIRLDRPRAEIWTALHDPALLATCVPGARLIRAADGQIEGEMRMALGPMTAVFAGAGASWRSIRPPIRQRYPVKAAICRVARVCPGPQRSL